MIISIINQKGGVGKTTVAITFSNFLNEFKELIVFDFDFQESFFLLWEEQTKLVESDSVYPVMAKDLSESKDVVSIAKENSDSYFIMDLPGKIDDNNLLPFYQDTDFFIVPFSYDKIVFESTLVFSQTVKHIQPNSKLLFLPNRIKKSVNYGIKDKVDNVLSTFGTVLPPIYDRVAFQRLSVLENSSEVSSVCEPAFKEILNIIDNV